MSHTPIHKIAPILGKYYTRYGYLGPQRLWNQLQKDNIPVTHKEMHEFVKKQLLAQLTAQPRKEKVYRTIVAAAPMSNVQIDIMIYDRRKIHGYGAILGCIDVHSRYVVCIPLTSREQKSADSSVMRGIRKMFQLMGIPKAINCDNEFTSNEFRRYCDEHSIELYLSNADEAVINSKNAIIERFWRTLAGLLRNYNIQTGDSDWPTYLDKVVKAYNKSYHGTIRATPDDVFHGNDVNKQDVITRELQYSLGDIVRIRTQKGTFSKGDRETFSRARYRLVEQDKNRWKLENIDTGTQLQRSYMERDFALANETVNPNYPLTRKRDNDAKLIAKAPALKRQAKELQQLKTDATDFFAKPSNVKRTRKPVQPFDL